MMKKRFKATKRAATVANFKYESLFTTLRIIDKHGYVNGEWFCAPDNQVRLDYVKGVLKKHTDEEPNSGWRLQTRGMNLDWHDWAE